MMRTVPYTIDCPAAGRLGIMSRPAGGDWLADDLAALRERGVEVLVSALTADEYARLELDSEPAAAVAVGLVFMPFPIVDFGVPDLGDLRELSRRLADEVTGGRYVVAHCFGGVGRSSVIAAATLIQLGLSAQEAVERIGAARGRPVPETQAQRDVLDLLYEHRADPDPRTLL